MSTSLDDLMRRRHDWINKTGKFLFNHKVSDIPYIEGAFPLYYRVLAHFEKQIADIYESEYCEEKVEIIK